MLHKGNVGWHRGTHAEDAGSCCANGTCADQSHNFAAQLKAHKPRQCVVARPHADVCQVQIPAAVHILDVK